MGGNQKLILCERLSIGLNGISDFDHRKRHCFFKKFQIGGMFILLSAPKHLLEPIVQS